MCREGPAGRNVNESSNASEEVLQLSSGALGVNVSTQTGRLLSLTSNAGLLSASLNAEVCHLAQHCRGRGFETSSMLVMGPPCWDAKSSLHRVDC